MNEYYTTWQEYRERHQGYKWLVAAIAVAFFLFQFLTALFGGLEALKQREVHLLFGLVLVFLLKPLSLGKEKRKEPGWLDYLAVLASVIVIAHNFFRHDWITAIRFSRITPMSGLEVVLGIMAVLLILESTRRMAGNSLVYVVVAFLVYPFISPYLPGILNSATIPWTDLLDFMYLGTDGIFGTAIGISATDIALYIFFGSLLVRSGGADLINNIAGALTGKSRGGPAKVAVVASSLMGTINGSGTANVATVGVVTIPMMKKAGYSPVFAAGVESVASTGGQIMPPVMGAAAFVVSAFSGIPYITICKYAIFPAILYYIGLFAAVHLNAIRNKLLPVVTDTTLKETLLKYGHMLIPIFCLIGALIAGFTPRMAAGIAVLVALVISNFKSTSRLGFWGTLEAFEDGAKGMLIITTATAAAGLIVGVVEITSVGQRLGAGFVDISGGYLFPALVLGMLLSILLGMGMPTTPAYIIMAATVIPALIFMGLPPFVAHMFAFYFCCLSLITPPVAITAYAASAIAGSDMWQTGWTAFRLGLPAYIVPFMFVYNQTLLLEGALVDILITAATAIIGVVFLAVAGEGFLMRALSWPERVISLLAALFLIAPTTITILPAVVLIALLLFLNLRGREKSLDVKP